MTRAENRFINRYKRATANQEWREFFPGFQLREGLRLEVTETDQYCGSGGRRYWRLINTAGEWLEAGETCACGRGCGNSDCIRDDWGYRDTVIEQYRC